ncbi:MAG: type IVB secretion system protein IcmW [Coxiellaceae bacterium]|jgi:intracellular multiplication protein IcmW|nr:type IVB secretion system protein IcmW [Coxiellaceae bacterium]
MPDLTTKGSHQFWREYPDRTIYKMVAFMEGVESWTFDGNPELEQALTKLSSALDNVGNIDLQEEDKLIQISLYIKMGRALKLVQCLDIAHPGAASKVLMYAEANQKKNNDIFALFLRRNVVFERLRLFNRIFSEERLASIQKVLE